MKNLMLLLSLLYTSIVLGAPQFRNTLSEGLYTPIKNRSEAFDESINFQPGINLYNDASQLTDLFGTKGSQLCAPNSITHTFNYLKFHRNPTSPGLATIADLDNDGTQNTYRDQIRYFFQTCKTDREIGTYYSQALNCIRDFMTISGYTAWAYMIGIHSQEESTNLPLNTDHVRYYVSAKVGAIMTVGWYKYNEATGAYDRTGGHFFNVYGYDYNTAWGAERLQLKVVNSWVNYTGRSPDQMFDDIMMTKFAGGPHGMDYELTGPGLTFDGYKTLVEDLYVVVPVVP